MMLETKTLSRVQVAQTLFVATMLVLWCAVSLVVVFAISMSHLREYRLLASLDSVTTGLYVGTDIVFKEEAREFEEISEYFLVYEYTVDGELYPGRTVTTFGTFVNFVPGEEVDVRYAAADPSFSVVNQTPSLANFVGSVGFFVVWAAIVGVVLYNFVWGSETLRVILNMRKGKFR